MKVTAIYFSIFLITVFVLCGCSRSQNITINKNLPNFSKVNAKLYRGGQPTEAGVKLLKEQHGIKTIVLFRSTGEDADSEGKWAEAAGVKFINLPLHNWFAPKHAQIRAALAEITKPENHPVFVHCQRGADRTGTVIAVYRMTHEGWTAEQANEEAKKFGIGWWQILMKDYINDYYRDVIGKK